jgi:plasmid stabilization system protein ParE
LKIVFAPEAEEDLLAALDFLAARRPAAAAQLLGSVGTLVRRLADGDFEGPEARLRSGETVRSWPVSPYRLYYQRSYDELRVVRIYHQARRPIAR